MLSNGSQTLIADWQGSLSSSMRPPCIRSSDHGRRRAGMEDDAKRVRPLYQAKRWPRTTRGREGGKNWQTSKVGLWPAIGPGESSRRRSERVLERKGLSSTGVHVERCLTLCTARTHDEHHRGTTASSAGISSRRGTDSKSIQGRIYTEIEYRI